MSLRSFRVLLLLCSKRVVDESAGDLGREHRHCACGFSNLKTQAGCLCPSLVEGVEERSGIGGRHSGDRQLAEPNFLILDGKEKVGGREVPSEQ